MPIKPIPIPVTITVDGRQIEAEKGEMVIAAAERAGIHIPRFCWHPRMDTVGMCRMCLIEQKGPRGWGLAPACYVPASEGAEFQTQSPTVKKIQDGVLEFLLINHPLDCPVCDKGGECPLQDNTMAFGPGESRFVEEKVHFEKPIPVSDLVLLDRERCIVCARCTRFADEIAGDPLITIGGRGDTSEIATFPDDPFSSYFSGNTVQICPVGALTAAPYRFKARPWDLEQVESTCTTCGMGCRIAVQSSQNQVTRYLGVDVEGVNHGWLCDKGRFGYEAVNNLDSRLTEPLVRRDNNLVSATWGEALDAAATGLGGALDLHGPEAIGVIGGARLANEDAYVWARLAKSVLRTDNTDAQLGDGLDPRLVATLPQATIEQACWADTLLLVAPDLKEELPVLYLRLKRAIEKNGVNVIELSPTPTGLSRYVTHSLRHRAGEAHLVVKALLAEADTRQNTGGVEAESLNAARTLLADEGSVVAVIGRQSLADTADSIAAAAMALLAARPKATFLPVLRRANVRGAMDAGLAPGLLPGRVALEDGRDWFIGQWGHAPEVKGMNTEGMMLAAAEGRMHGLVLLGADPMSDLPDRDLARRAMHGAGFVVAVDTFLNDSNRHADVILPAAGFAERSGTTTNIEGRVSVLGQKLVAPGVAWPDWLIAVELANALTAEIDLASLAEIGTELERVSPLHRGLTGQRLAESDASDGLLLPLEGPKEEESWSADETDLTGRGHPQMVREFQAPVVDLPHVDGYALRLVASRKLYNNGTMVQHSPHLASLAAEDGVYVHPSDLARLGLHEGDEARVVSPRTAVTARVRPDSRLPKGTAYMAWNTAMTPPGELIDLSSPVTDVRLESL